MVARVVGLRDGGRVGYVVGLLDGGIVGDEEDGFKVVPGLVGGIAVVGLLVGVTVVGFLVGCRVVCLLVGVLEGAREGIFVEVTPVGAEVGERLTPGGATAGILKFLCEIALGVLLACCETLLPLAVPVAHTKYIEPLVGTTRDNGTPESFNGRVISMAATPPEYVQDVPVIGAGMVAGEGGAPLLGRLSQR